MLTAALALLCLWLAVCAGVAGLLWRSAAGEVRDQARLIRHLAGRCDGYRAELDALAADLDALSIAGPAIDTATGSHDRLPIRDDIRRTLTDYCEGMWHHTLNGDAK